MATLTMKEAERDCRCRMCDRTQHRKLDVVFKCGNSYRAETFILCVHCVSELRAMYEMYRLGATDLTVEV